MVIGFRNKLLVFTVLAFLGFSLWSCENTSKESQQEKSEQRLSDAGLSLNNGQKWTVSKEMRPYINNGKLMVSAYLSKGETDYHALAVYLKQQDDSLISSCHMQGDAHDALHKWLHPHLELVHQLADATSKKEARKIVFEIQNSFNQYNKYFH